MSSRSNDVDDLILKLVREFGHAVRTACEDLAAKEPDESLHEGLIRVFQIRLQQLRRQQLVPEGQAHRVSLDIFATRRYATSSVARFALFELLWEYRDVAALQALFKRFPVLATVRGFRDELKAAFTRDGDDFEILARLCLVTGTASLELDVWECQRIPQRPFSAFLDIAEHSADRIRFGICPSLHSTPFELCSTRNCLRLCIVQQVLLESVCTASNIVPTLRTSVPLQSGWLVDTHAHQSMFVDSLYPSAATAFVYLHGLCTQVHSTLTDTLCVLSALELPVYVTLAILRLAHHIGLGLFRTEERARAYIQRVYDYCGTRDLTSPVLPHGKRARLCK
jgi:hypothetical protein